jgi:hypothetical protein
MDQSNLQECAARIAAEMNAIAQIRMNGTQPPATRAINRAEIEISFEEVKKLILDQREREIEAYIQEHQRMEQRQMATQELDDQFRARARFLTKLSDIANDQSNIKLSDLAGAIRFLEEKKNERSWEETIEQFDGYSTQIDDIKAEMLELLRSYYTGAKNTVAAASRQIQNNGFPTLCYIMTFLCVLPLECREAVVQYLQGTPLGNLASMSLSEQACVYWKAKTATYMYAGAENIDIPRAMNMLYGAGINCKDMCFALLFNFNTIVRMAGASGLSAASSGLSAAAGVASNFMYGLASKLSDRFKLVDINLSQEVSDDSSVASGVSGITTYSIASGPSEDSLRVQILVPEATTQAAANEIALVHYNSSRDNRMVDNFIATMQQRGPSAAANQSQLTRIQAPAYNAAAPDLQSPVDDDIVFTPSGTHIYPNVYSNTQDDTPSLVYGIAREEDGVNVKRQALSASQSQSQENFGGRRRKRKSMHHRKRRSTIRRKKGRRGGRKTKKGKKKRYTKKRH